MTDEPYQVNQANDAPEPTYANDDPEPVFPLRGQDILSYATILNYRARANDEGLREHVVEVDKALDEWEAWQNTHQSQVKFPFHVHVSARELQQKREQEQKKESEIKVRTWNLLRAVDRMRDDWSEGDTDRRNYLWTDVHTQADELHELIDP